MYAVLEQYGGYVLAGVWVVGAVLIGWRFRAYQVTYLKKLPAVNGVPLYMVLGENPAGAEARALYSAMWHRQPDPELERMRREARRRYRHLGYWIFGFPVLAIGVAALVLAFFPH